MAKKESKKNKYDEREERESSMNPRIRQIVIAIILLVITVVILFGAFDRAGIVGEFIYHDVLEKFFGFGVILVPIMLVVYAVHLLRNKSFPWSWVEYTSSLLLVASTLGWLQIISPTLRGGGLLGYWIGNLITKLFDIYAGAVILGSITLVSLLVLINDEFNIPAFLKKLFTAKEDVTGEEDETTTIKFTAEELLAAEAATPAIASATETPVEKEPKITIPEEEDFISSPAPYSETYEYPPVSLLTKSSGKPSVGDIKAHANLIKRTLLNFGIDVEMDEVSIGPTVTRYALKPAEGIKLARIVALKSDLALALAAHPIRIEAPIPGKSLVGIEIPNRIKSMVGLGSLIEEPGFQDSPHRLQIVLGKGVTGKSYYANISKMPHLLIAGTTGSGKSVTVHNIIMSLVFRNGPEDLRFIMVDPKRVELTLYNDIPHLLTPVIKDPKKAVLALKWAAKEMERRYDILEKNSCRDIGSYREKLEKGSIRNTHDDGSDIKMPFIVIIIDELADIMQAYPRELESGIVRLAQMSRAVGIHLVLSTQRPSVNVITGLIKANIPSRLALQVASQIDSRTILDAPGAESLLGKGDMLYQGEGMSKPERMQCANVDEEEVKKIVSFIKKHNQGLPDEIVLGETLDNDRSIVSAEIDSDDEDTLYEDARAVIMEAGKASTSYLQRKLKVGYSRAARLIDMLEERGVVGPADGAKPREVLDASPRTEDYESPELSPDSEDSEDAL